MLGHVYFLISFKKSDESENTNVDRIISFYSTLTWKGFVYKWLQESLFSNLVSWETRGKLSVLLRISQTLTYVY